MPATDVKLRQLHAVLKIRSIFLNDMRTEADSDITQPLLGFSLVHLSIGLGSFFARQIESSAVIADGCQRHSDRERVEQPFRCLTVRDGVVGFDVSEQSCGHRIIELAANVSSPGTSLSESADRSYFVPAMESGSPRRRLPVQRIFASRCARMRKKTSRNSLDFMLDEYK